MKALPLPATDVLRATFDYDPISGLLIWKVCNCFGERRKGKEAGTVSTKDGYKRFKWNGRRFLTHRVIWKLVYGVDPGDQIDHDDGNRANNAIGNLRDATRPQNQQNRHVVAGALPKGVYFDKDRSMFVAQIKTRQRKQYIGSFATSTAAHDAYVAEAKRHFGEFACAGDFTKKDVFA